MSLLKRNSGLPALNSMIDSFFNDRFINTEFATNTLPSVNVKENENEFTIEVAAPGLTREDIKVEITHGILTIASEKKEETAEENDKFTRKEFNYSSFQRSFHLPDNIDEDSIKANYNDGVLNITIAKTNAKSMQSKTITIN